MCSRVGQRERLSSQAVGPSEESVNGKRADGDIMVI